jgi:hypothetical protein
MQDVINADSLKRLTEYVGLLQQLNKGAFDDVVVESNTAAPLAGAVAPLVISIYA